MKDKVDAKERNEIWRKLFSPERDSQKINFIVLQK